MIAPRRPEKVGDSDLARALRISLNHLGGMFFVGLMIGLGTGIPVMALIAFAEWLLS